jgi:Ubiquitin-like domain
VPAYQYNSIAYVNCTLPLRESPDSSDFSAQITSDSHPEDCSKLGKSKKKTPKMSAFQPTAADISVIISTVDENSNAPSLATERRVTPSWTVLQLKAKLETITGIPPGCQRLRLVVPGNEDQWIEGEERRIGEWTLLKGCEIQVRI